MGLGLFILAITAFFCGIAAIMNHNGRKEDRRRRGLSD
jgi:hypothetical protein